jgi:hypothetical protein
MVKFIFGATMFFGGLATPVAGLRYLSVFLGAALIAMAADEFFALRRSERKEG